MGNSIIAFTISQATTTTLRCPAKNRKTIMKWFLLRRFLKTAEALQVKGLAQHPFLSSGSGGEEELEEEEEETEDVEQQGEQEEDPRPLAWSGDQQKTPSFKQVGVMEYMKTINTIFGGGGGVSCAFKRKKSN